MLSDFEVSLTAIGYTQFLEQTVGKLNLIYAVPLLNLSLKLTAIYFSVELTVI